jgi:hypothetical protein
VISYYSLDALIRASTSLNGAANETLLVEQEYTIEQMWAGQRTGNAVQKFPPQRSQKSVIIFVVYSLYTGCMRHYTEVIF